jgi:Xaa-Pro aminopeptidase
MAPEFVSPSFETIAGSGPNGAIVHYRVTDRSNRKLKAGELFLLDSGGQYPDGTTDVTRTIAVGKPSAEHRERFTRVLKGHIAIASARFPEGIGGTQLDVLARENLWEAGLDYDHGTGHGVGCFLNVHEGPQRISKRGGDAALQTGMIVSNEPGYYREGHYGIRIESLVAVKEVGKMESGKAALGFETLTCVPLDARLVDKKMLTPPEKKWWNAYQAWVLKTHEKHLSKQEKAWLQRMAKPLT